MPEPFPYKLSLGPGLEAFRPEIDYVFDVLDGWYPLVRREDAARVVHYGAAPPSGAAVIPAVLFPDAVEVDRDGIRLAARRFDALLDGQGSAPLVPSIGNSTRDARLGYDAIGLIFSALSRIEERDAPSRDRYGRFPFTAAFLTRLGRHADPLADAVAHELAALIASGPLQPRSNYAVRLTHDVDSLRGYHRLIEPLRYAAGDVVKRGKPAAAFWRLYDAYASGEPWHSFRDIMSTSERYGISSNFYFMGPSENRMDSPYAMTMTGLLRRVVEEIAERGHRIGFHPGVATVDDPEEWQRQRTGLEAVLGRRVAEGRQHVLMYRAERTPDIWDAAGMQFECTLGYPEASGFRPGTCRPFPAYSLTARRRLTLMQGATAIMDFGLFGAKYRDLDLDAALDDCRPAIAACRRYGGELNILFHTGQSRGLVRKFYDRLLMEAIA